MTPEQTKLDKYYLKTFGWTLAEVDALFARQENVCAICKRPPGKYRLSLDHAHSFDRIKIIVHRPPTIKEWFAETVTNKLCMVHTWGATRKLAKDLVKQHLRRRSVRGGLCLRCNKGLQMFEDSKAPLSPAERFDRAAKYFRDFELKLSAK